MPGSSSPVAGPIFISISRISWSSTRRCGSRLFQFSCRLQRHCGAFAVHKQHRVRRKELRKLAHLAYRTALLQELVAVKRSAHTYKKELSPELKAVLEDRAFLDLCADLAGDSEKKRTAAKAKFYSSLDPGLLGHYMQLESPQMRAAHLVALLTEMPPRWIYRCGEELVI